MRGKAMQVLKGKIENVKRVATRTENMMITFTVGGTPCKAFGKGAETISDWVHFDPNIFGELEGYFDKRSQRFGEEFVAVHGKPIEAEKKNNANSEITSSAPSAPAEPVPAKEAIRLSTDLLGDRPRTALSYLRPARPSLSADDFVSAESQCAGRTLFGARGGVERVSPVTEEPATPSFEDMRAHYERTMLEKYGPEWRSRILRGRAANSHPKETGQSI